MPLSAGSVELIAQSLFFHSVVILTAPSRLTIVAIVLTGVGFLSMQARIGQSAGSSVSHRATGAGQPHLVLTEHPNLTRSPISTRCSTVGSEARVWRRTEFGWERLYVRPPATQTRLLARVSRVHPLVVAGLQFLISLGALVAFDKSVT